MTGPGILFTVFLPEDIVELAVGNEEHSAIGCCARMGGSDESDGCFPTCGAIGKIKLALKRNGLVALWGSLVPTTGILFL